MLMALSDTHPKPTVQRHSTEKQVEKKKNAKLVFWCELADCDERFSRNRLIFASAKKAVTLPFYLFHFESFLRRFVVAAAWLLEIFLVHFHFLIRSKCRLPLTKWKTSCSLVTEIFYFFAFFFLNLFRMQPKLSIQLDRRSLSSLYTHRMLDAKLVHCSNALVCACTMLNTDICQQFDTSDSADKRWKPWAAPSRTGFLFLCAAKPNLNKRFIDFQCDFCHL